MSVRLKDFRTYDQRMKALLELPPSTFVQNARTRIDPSRIVYVDMDCAAVTAPGATYEILGTDSLATCMGLAVHNTATGATGLTHLSQEGATTEVSIAGADSLITMLNHVRGTGGHLEARIIGPNIGWPLNEEFINEVLDILQEYGVEVISADFAHKKGLSIVAAHAGLWNEGLIRGKVHPAEVMNAHAQGEEAKVRLFAEVVNLEHMGVTVRPTTDGLTYNGLTEISYEPEPGPL